jgi:hypothetical protein
MGVHGSFGSNAINAVNAVIGLDDREAKSKIFRIGEFNKRKARRVHSKGGYVGAYTFADLLEDRYSRKGKKFYSQETIEEAVEAKVDWIEADDVEGLYEGTAKARCRARFPRNIVRGDRQAIYLSVVPTLDYTDPRADYEMRFRNADPFELEMRRQEENRIGKPPPYGITYGVASSAALQTDASVNVRSRHVRRATETAEAAEAA